jgi:hypothetical protein
MASATFEATLGSIFDRSEHAIADELDKAKVRAESLQAMDTNRLAFTLTEAVEHILAPAIEQSLSIYDAAINRPITPNQSWETAIRQRIVHSVDAGVAQALALDGANHSWKPLIREEAPKLRARMLLQADRHFGELAKRRKAAERRPRPIENPIRAGLFVAGLAVGALVMRLLAG